MAQLVYQPMRRCAGCGVSKPKAELIRIACSGEKLSADPEAKLPGRGVYICRSEACLASAVKKGGFSRSLRRHVSGAALAGLSGELSDLIK